MKGKGNLVLIWWLSSLAFAMAQEGSVCSDFPLDPPDQKFYFGLDVGPADGRILWGPRRCFLTNLRVDGVRAKVCLRNVVGRGVKVVLNKVDKTLIRQMSAGINPECDGKPQFQKRRTVDKARGIDGFKQLIVDWDEIPASSPGCCETTRCLDFKATVVDPNDLVTMTDVVIDDPGCGLAGECEIQITCPNLVTTGMRGIGLQGRQVYSGTDFDDVIILPETHPRELYAYGNPGNDYFIGSEDPDRIHGNGSGNDIMLGNGGDDFLYPAEGADRVFGGDGNDQFRFLDPDGSVDLLSGGDGVDTVTFAFLTSSLEPIDVLKSVEIVEQP